MKARFLWATVIVLTLLSLPTLVMAQPPFVSSTGPSGGCVEGAPLGSPDALWDQPSSYNIAVASQYFPNLAGGAYSADDFSNTNPWNIESIFVAGCIGAPHLCPDSLPQADSLSWFIYTDAGGVPGGHPESGGEVWSHTCLPGDTEVTFSGANSDAVTLDIVQAQGGPLYLLPGTYWLCFYPSWDYTKPGEHWFWYGASTSNLMAAQLIDPTGLISSYSSWTPWPTVTTAMYPSYDAAFRIEGTALEPPPPTVKYLHAEGGWMNITDPIGTQWHELWPIFCREYHLSSWNDTSGDGELSYCDRIDMYEKPDGEVRWYHVEEVTITLNVTPGRDAVGFGFNGLPPPMFIELEGGYNASVLMNPVGTQWHEIYPFFCTTYNLTGWTDNGSTELDYCDYIWLRNKHTGEETEWHVEEVAIDIVVTIEPPPVGGEAYPVSKASLLAPWIAVGAVLAGSAIWYVLRRRRAQS